MDKNNMKVRTKGYIYKITSPSNSIYIGQTIDPSRRFREYKNSKAISQPKLKHSILKYGWDNHKWEIIDEVWCGYNKEILNIREMYWINEYDSFNNGLNLTKGGDGCLGKKHTEETKKKLSDSHIGQIAWNKGKKHTEETKKKMSNKSSGENNAFYGKKHTEETKKKLSKSNKGKKMSDETKVKMSNAKKGKKLTEEQKKRLYEAHQNWLLNKNKNNN